MGVVWGAVWGVEGGVVGGVMWRVVSILELSSGSSGSCCGRVAIWVSETAWS